MTERSRSSKPLLIGGFVVVAIAAIGGSYFMEMRRHDGRSAAARVSNDIQSAESALADLRTAEVSAIAAGSDTELVNTWLNTATALQVQLEAAVASLNATTTSAAARSHYETAGTLVQEIAPGNRKARDLIATQDPSSSTDQTTSARAVVSDNSQPAKKLSAELLAAREAEIADFEKGATKIGWIALGINGAALLSGLLLLIAGMAARNEQAEEPVSFNPTPVAASPADEFLREAPRELSLSVPDTATAPTAPMADLSKAADLCVDLGRVSAGSELPELLGRAASLLDAKGVVLWVIDSTGTSLRPTVAHGYSERIIQRMGTLPVDGDNVTSLAYRTRQPQVLNGGGDGRGALAVPLVTTSGCVGVLATEVSGAKAGDTKFALARIVAAQLATLVSPA